MSFDLFLLCRDIHIDPNLDQHTLLFRRCVNLLVLSVLPCILYSFIVSVEMECKDVLRRAIYAACCFFFSILAQPI